MSAPSLRTFVRREQRTRAREKRFHHDSDLLGLRLGNLESALLLQGSSINMLGYSLFATMSAHGNSINKLFHSFQHLLDGFCGSWEPLPRQTIRLVDHLRDDVIEKHDITSLVVEEKQAINLVDPLRNDAVDQSLADGVIETGNADGIVSLITKYGHDDGQYNFGESMQAGLDTNRVASLGEQIFGSSEIFGHGAATWDTMGFTSPDDMQAFKQVSVTLFRHFLWPDIEPDESFFA